jgi:arsenate reductase (glutaredoxin)
MLMTILTIYHNPRCSKSRETLDILKQQTLDLVIIEYLKEPLSYEQLLALRTHLPLKDFVRSNDPLFKTLTLSLDDEESVLKAMCKAPQLMQRPIVLYQKKAVIGRPPEKVLSLFMM